MFGDCNKLNLFITRSSSILYSFFYVSIGTGCEPGHAINKHFCILEHRNRKCVDIWTKQFCMSN